MGKKLNIQPGDEYNRLVIIEEGLKDKHGNRCFRCLCCCGNVLESVTLNNLSRGNTKSCGCLNSEKTTQRNIQSRKYKQGFELEKSSWTSMFQRCYNQDNNRYQYYGARGITVCERWSDFNNFLADMGPRPGKKYSLDRINNNDNYKPENCKWSTDKEQANNKSNNNFITIFNETKTVKEWSRDYRCVVNYKTLWSRLNSGWLPQEAITLSVRK